MSPFEVYEMYLAIKMHFTQPSYDYFKYSGKVKSNIESFNKRKDRYFFEKLSRKKARKDVLNYFVSNFIESSDPSKMWVGEMKISGEDNYLKWKGRVHSFTYLFESDLNTLTEDCHLYEAIISKSGHPKIIKSYLAGRICLESVVVMDDLTKFMSKLPGSSDPVLEIIRSRVSKYRPFFVYDKDSVVRVIRSKM
jgi:hypothetical protein